MLTLAVACALAGGQLLGISGCKGRQHEFRYKEAQVEPEPSNLGVTVPHAREADDVLAAPDPGLPAAAQIKELWSATQARVRADLDEDLEDEEYFVRRDPMLTRWFDLYFAHTEEFRRAGLESSEIVELLNDVYGFSAEPEQLAQRAAKRADRREIERKISSIDSKIQQIQ